MAVNMQAGAISSFSIVTPDPVCVAVNAQRNPAIGHHLKQEAAPDPERLDCLPIKSLIFSENL